MGRLIMIWCYKVQTWAVWSWSDGLEWRLFVIRTVIITTSSSKKKTMNNRKIKPNQARKKLPFVSIWLWYWTWVRWNLTLETSDLLQPAELPLSKSRWTKSLRLKSPTRLPALLTLFKGISGSAEEIFPFPLRFPDLLVLRFWVLVFPFGFEAQLPIVVEANFFTIPANIFAFLNRTDSVCLLLIIPQKNLAKPIRNMIITRTNSVYIRIKKLIMIIYYSLFITNLKIWIL